MGGEQKRPVNRNENSDVHEIRVIARIRSEFPEKFGIPRQSGLVKELKSTVIFEPEYRNPDAVRGLSDYSHIWLIWQFSEAVRKDWSPTVRPPRLGGNTRMGVFATRSPFRPNAIGLSPVRLISVENDEALGPVLKIAGADLMDHTPIYDIKPYLPYVDSHPDAKGGFTENVKDYGLTVMIPDRWLAVVPPDRREALRGVLASDPRPSYQNDPDRIYGMSFAGLDVRFQVAGPILTVCEVTVLRVKDVPDEMKYPVSGQNAGLT